MIDYFQILCGLAVVFLSIYYYFTSTFDFWTNLGVKGPRPTIFIGNFLNLLKNDISIGDQMKLYYNEYKHEPMFGLFLQRTPVLLVNDLDLIKDILIKDFSLFADRGVPIFKKAEPLSEHLFSLDTARWRPLRAKLSPVFTSGKLKEMFPLVVECSKHLEKYVDTLVERGEPVECRDLSAKYTTEVIGSCAFGIEMNSISDKDSEFRRMGRKVFATNFAQRMRMYLKQFLPTIYELLGQWIQPRDINNFFINVVDDTINYREQNKIFRPDFINTLMDLKKHPEKLENIELTKELLTSQAFVFFLAGFETSSTTISHALYELALNPQIQDKLRQEIRESFEKNGEELQYDHVKQMKYLDMVFKETLRKYPVLAMLMRAVSQNYTFKGTKITIPKGTKLWIPVYAIQRNPDVYPDPDTFDPERFTNEAVAARHPMSYLPFGDGSRNCIGARFANYQSKAGIISILRNHKVEVCEKTRIPYKSDPSQFLLLLKDGVTLKIIKAKN